MTEPPWMPVAPKTVKSFDMMNRKDGLSGGLEVRRMLFRVVRIIWYNVIEVLLEMV
jgi:hypothetical protein